MKLRAGSDLHATIVAVDARHVGPTGFMYASTDAPPRPFVEEA